MRTHSTRSYGWTAAGVIALAGAGCLSGENIDLGHNLDASAPSTPPASSDAGSSQVQDQPLGAQIRVAPRGTICAGQCVQLSVVPTGGGGSYMYHWGEGEDGGDDAGPIDVCPVTTTTYSVIVSAAESDIVANATLTITVVACDAGAPDSTADAGGTQPTGAQDADTPVEPLCVPNPSFDGVATTGPVGPPGSPATTTPPQWQACEGYPSVDPAESPLPLEDGKSNVGLPVGTGTFSDFTSSLGTTLCNPLEPGVEYYFCVDVAVAFNDAVVPPGFSPPTLQIRGGTSACDQSVPLWTSPPITSTASWTKDCANFFSPQPVSNIVLVPSETAAAGTSSWSYVIVSDIVGGS
jgi:hypothetical protein